MPGPKKKHEGGKDRTMLTTILPRLRGVRKTKQGYIALCPAHADRRPSLSLRETTDGRILIHCFAGCPTENILAALGLTWRDLMPQNGAGPARGGSKRTREEWTRRQAEMVLERAYERAAAETLRELARIIRHAETLLWRCGGWHVLFLRPGGGLPCAISSRAAVVRFFVV